MTARPTLYGRFQPDGTLALFRGNRHCTTLLSRAAIDEALECGWVVSNGWRDELHDVVLMADAHDRLLSALKASVAL